MDKSSTAQENSDGTVNVQLKFIEDEVCHDDLVQLEYLIGKGVDTTGLLQCIADKLQEALTR